VGTLGRRGVEPKPPWRALPAEVRRAVEEALGARVRRALRTWGGYAPTPTFRLALADGRSAFCKAVGPAANDFMRAALAGEERVYRELGHRIAPWAPGFLGSWRVGAWHGLLLTDLGPGGGLPRSAAGLRRLVHAYADFHRSSAGRDLPVWLPRPSASSPWDRLGSPAGAAAVAAALGERGPAAAAWLAAAAPRLATAAAALADPGLRRCLLHGDTRSDNLHWRGGRLRLFDWPFAAVGPAEWDLAAFAQAVAAEGGPGPAVLVAWYGERAPVAERALDAALARLAGYFLSQAWQPDPPGLPRLRAFQRRQADVSLRWAAARLGLPSPDWLPPR
jgi:hypothetical protein